MSRRVAALSQSKALARSLLEARALMKVGLASSHVGLVLLFWALGAVTLLFVALVVAQPSLDSRGTLHLPSQASDFELEL